MKSLFKNITYLYLVRTVSLTSPLVVIPHLFKVLGPDHFGALFFAQSFVLYLGILIDFGFELYAPGKIAQIIKREDVNLFVSKVQFSKIILGVVTGVIVIIASFAFSHNINSKLYLAWFGVILFQSSIPIWFFQGIGELSRISFIQALGRILSLFLTLSIVNSQDDVITYPIIESSILFFISLISWVVYHRLGYKIVRVGFRSIFETLKQSFSLFISKISISLYTVSGTFVLGLMTDLKVVAYYTAPMKIIETLGSLMGPVNQVIYPYISSKVSLDTKSINPIYLKKYLYLSALVGFLVSMGLFLFQDFIVFNYLKAHDDIVLGIFRVMAFLPMFIFLSNVLGIQILLGHGYSKEFSLIISSSSLIGFILILLLTYLYSAIGTASAVLIVEIIITLWMFLKVKKDILTS